MTVKPEQLQQDTTAADSDLVMKTNSAGVTKTINAGNFFTWLWGKIKAATKSSADTSDPTAPINTNALNGALTNYVENAINLGNDGGTVEKNLGGGVYLYLTNLHPFNPYKGIYVITVGSQPAFNTVTTYIEDPTISSISISTTENKLTVTTISAFRGAFIKLCDYIV